MDAKKMAKRAKGNVDRALLEGSGTGSILSTGYFGDGPIIYHLKSGEQIEYALQNLTKGLNVQHDGVEETVAADANLRTALLVTDNRLIYVVGQSDGDETFSVPLEECSDVDVSTGFLKNRLTVHAEFGTYDMYAQKGPDVHAIANDIETASTPDSEPTDPGSRRMEDSGSAPPSEGGQTDADDQEDDDQGEQDNEPTGGDAIEPVVEDASQPTCEEDCRASNIPTRLAAKSDGGVSKPSSSTIEILVSDQVGTPIDGATVDVTGSTFEGNGRTSDTGRFEITLPETLRTVDLRISHPEYISSKAEVPVSDGAVIDVSLEPDGNAGTTHTSTEDHTEASAGSDGEEQDVPRDRLLEELTTLNERSSRQVTRGNMRADGRFEPEDYEDEFGTWSAALEEATFGDNEDEEKSAERSDQQEAYTKEDVLDAITAVLERVDGRPNISEMNKYGEMSPSPAYRYFDSWSDAVDAAEKRLGDQSQAKTESGYTKQQVIEEIAEVASKIGGRPSTFDLKEHSQMSTSHPFRYFDTWDEAVKKARAASTMAGGEGPTADTENEVDDGPLDRDGAKGNSSGDTTVEWGQSIDGPLAGDIHSVPEGRLSNAVVKIVQEKDATGSKRDAVVEVETAAGEHLDLIIWQKHDVEFDVSAGDIVRMDEVRLKRWGENGRYEHELSSTRGLSVTPTEVGQSGGDSGPQQGDGGGEQKATVLERFAGIGGATQGDAEALFEAGYSTKDDLKEASLEELRSINGLDDGTALRMKAEFG